MRYLPGAPAPRRTARRFFALALVCVLNLAGACRAADYFACDCAAGAAPGCAAGSDQAAGTTPATAWRSYDRAQDAFSTLSAGDTLHFCRGGVFPVVGSTRWVNTRCRAAAPCTVGAYTAGWSQGGEDLPRIERSSSGDAISLENGGDAQHEEGYVFRDIELVCTDCGSNGSGFFLYNDIDDVQLRDLRIRGFGVGIFHGGSRPCAAGTMNCDARNSRLHISGSEIRDSAVQGFLGAGEDLLIDGNTFTGNGRSGILEHNVYISGDAPRVRVANNTLYRSAARNGQCEGASLVAHGSLTDLVIEGNYIHEDIGGAAPSCWGINLSPAYNYAETILRAVIRANTIHNVGNSAIALTSCVDCLVENNRIVHEQPFTTRAIQAPAQVHAADDALMQRLRVRNNSLHIAGIGGIGVRIDAEGSQHEVTGNAIQYDGAIASWACFSLDLPPAAYAAIDYNVCGYGNAALREWELGSGSLAQWRAQSGLDAHSRNTAPGFANPAAPFYNLEALDMQAGLIGAGHPRLGAPEDFFGITRPAPPDAGAHQNRDRVFADGMDH